MTVHVVQSRSIFGAVVLSVAALGLLLSACSGDNVGKLAPPAGGGAGGGAAGGGGTAGDRGGVAGAGGSSASDAAATGGAGGSGVAGAGGGSADNDAAGPSDGAPPEMQCVFHTEPPVDGGTSVPLDGASLSLDAAAEGGAIDDARGTDVEAPDAADGGARSDGGTAGEGGARADAGPATSITILTSPFLGPYLADASGRTLYTYGADLPGDCKYAPISNCYADCAIAWPIFDAGARTLAPGLDGAAFGTIQRADGTFQTTYFGWPLYYYKSDTASGVIAGQAKAKTWHAATVIPVGIVIMKGLDAVKYLADGAGRTLYMLDADTKGSASSDPVSTCNGGCLVDHPIFHRNRLSVVSSLVPTDFTIFVRAEGEQQLAYKGAPLYYGAADARSGDLNGATGEGWSVVVP